MLHLLIQKKETERVLDYIEKSKEETHCILSQVRNVYHMIFILDDDGQTINLNQKFLSIGGEYLMI